MVWHEITVGVIVVVLGLELLAAYTGMLDGMYTSTYSVRPTRFFPWQRLWVSWSAAPFSGSLTSDQANCFAQLFNSADLWTRLLRGVSRLLLGGIAAARFVAGELPIWAPL